MTKRIKNSFVLDDGTEKFRKLSNETAYQTLGENDDNDDDDCILISKSDNEQCNNS